MNRTHNSTQTAEIFKQARNVDNRNSTVTFNLAGIDASNKKELQAISLLSRYVETFPKNAGLHALLGDLHFSLQGLKNALPAHETAFRLDPQYLGISGQLATLYPMNDKPKKSGAHV